MKIAVRPANIILRHYSWTRPVRRFWPVSRDSGLFYFCGQGIGQDFLHTFESWICVMVFHVITSRVVLGGFFMSEPF